MRRHPHNTEAGAILALFVLSIPILLSLSVLALDAGRLYVSRSRLDKASRVATATALNIMALRGWGAMVAAEKDELLGYQTANALANGLKSNQTNEAVLNEMRIAAAETLRAYFPGDFTPDTSRGGYKSRHLMFSTGGQNSTTSPELSTLDMQQSAVMLQLQYQVPTFLLGALQNIVGGTTSGCQQDEQSSTYRCTVQSAFSRESGYLKPANIFLLLDTSGSMAIDAGDGKTKIEVLRQAVGSFIDMFNPHKDKIAVLDFGTTVKSQGQLKTFLDAREGAAHLDIKTSLNELQAAGQTNPCDALLEAASQISQNPGLRETDAKFVLLFTDGAPNVYRLDFPDTRNQERLNEAITAGSLSQAERDRGWYGWTVKWGERELTSCPTACDPNTPNCRPDFSCEPDPLIPNKCRICDPVYGLPNVRNAAGQDLPPLEIRDRLRLNADGRFVWMPTTAGSGAVGTPLEEVSGENGGPYTLVWKTKDTQADNYRWYGPSYLVHASQKIPAGVSLIDRIPSGMIDGREPPVTCGPGSRGTMPGSRQGTRWDMYNHSLYFASRVINRNWRVEGPNRALELFNLTRFRTNSGNNIVWPRYFGEEQFLSDAASANAAGGGHTGCLETLNAALPGMPEQRIYVGQSSQSLGNMNPAIVSNVDSASLKEVGEVVKTAELPYYCAIRAADYLRKIRNVTVFVIGLGPSATEKYGASCNDPMQNALDFDSRKDNFLRRLALAPESLSDPKSFMTGGSSGWNSISDFGYVAPTDLENIRIRSCNNHPLNNQRMTRGYSEAQANTAGPPAPGAPAVSDFSPNHLGAYYGSNNPSQLGGLFGAVAKQILLRLST
jgi:hypothetical protein